MPCVVEIEVLETRGSTPCAAGARMWVSETETRGTIGGGRLEYRAIERARAMLAAGKARDEGTVELGERFGQSCGGAVRLRFSLREDFPQSQAPAYDVVLYGAGHVGKEVARICERLPCRLLWVDPRAEMFPSEVAPNVRVRIAPEPDATVAEAPAGAYVLVMTHSHALDLAIVERWLRRGDFAFLGLIGSQTKAAKFQAALARKGLAPEAIARLVCPVGLFKAGKHPAEVAVSALAQVLERVHRAVGRPLESTVTLPH
ncbi:MAG: xanthine dehydrogenase accessory protein XdhC [Burkholderiales bacterium]|nr:xanthine dehydrogenase accessory protein XdhC [Burkholderiales bacterium]